MYLRDRERQILRLLGSFPQLTSAQIHSLLFADLASITPCYRALMRLLDSRLVVRIPQRVVGGSKGGSGAYVYTLPENSRRVVSFHSLAVADTWIALKQLERAGLLEVNGLSTEPDCWTTIGRTELRPDMYVELTINGSRLLLWLEVDMATEGQRQVRGKLNDYFEATHGLDPNQWFPGIIWVAIDDARARELRYFIEQLDDEAQKLFKVCTLESLPDALGIR